MGHQLWVVVPHLPHGTGPDEAVERQRILLDQLLTEQHIQDYILWYYTPMALPFSDHLLPRLMVYDCMDKLSAFLGAPPMIIEQERRLMSRSDVVFTGGYSLYEAKKSVIRRYTPFQVALILSTLRRLGLARLSPARFDQVPLNLVYLTPPTSVPLPNRALDTVA